MAVGHRLRDRSCGFYCGQRPQVRKQHGLPGNRDGLQRHRARSRRKQERGVFDGQGPGPHSSGGRHVAVGLVEGTPSTASTPGGKPAALRLLPLAEDEPPHHPTPRRRGSGTHPSGSQVGGRPSPGPVRAAPTASPRVPATRLFCRWNQAHKSSGTNFQGLPSKIDTLKEEMDEAGNKVEQCKVRRGAGGAGAASWLSPAAGGRS